MAWCHLERNHCLNQDIRCHIVPPWVKIHCVGNGKNFLIKKMINTFHIFHFLLYLTNVLCVSYIFVNRVKRLHWNGKNLTHCGQVMPYDNINLGQRLMAPSHYLNHCWVGIHWHSPDNNFTGSAQDITSENWVNIGSGNGLLPDGTKPLPEPVLTYHQ